MKKCSTAALLLAAAVSAAGRAEAVCEFAPDAPDTHLVQRGDTLWGLASIFLKNPWCWTRVWERNRHQITHPHWIYPGQTIALDRHHGTLSTIDTAAAGSTTAEPAAEQKLTPSARSMPLPESRPVPVLAPRLLESTARFSLSTAEAIAGAARIIGFADGRRMGSTGDTAFASGSLPSDTDFDVVRLMGPTRDPDSGALLALTLMRVGKAQLLQMDHTGLPRVQIRQANAELTAGDLLLRTTSGTDAAPSLQPLASGEGKIAAVLSGGGRASTGDVVMLNRGRLAGLARGNLIGVMKHVRISANDANRHAPSVAHPVAVLLVFDAVEQAALALVVRSNDAIGAGDRFGSLPAPD